MKSTNISGQYTKLLPFGVAETARGINFSLPMENSVDKVKIFSGQSRCGNVEYNVTDEYRKGGIYAFTVSGQEYGEKVRYALYDGEKSVKDRYAKVLVGNGDFGKRKSTEHVYEIYRDDFSWADEIRPCHVYEDSFIYRLHVRGFTRHKSSGVEAGKRGTFAGVADKIDYLKSLGVTAVELLPAYEFDECLMDGTETGKINYWGYGNAHYFAPKESYSSVRNGGQVNEFKNMVFSLHNAGIEVIMDFYFVPDTNPFLIIDCLRHWVLEYHIDGVHLNMEVAPVEMIKDDPVLASVKIFTDMWDVVDRFRDRKHAENKHLAIFNDDFMVNVRRFIKSDEGQTYGLSEKLKRNPDRCGVINYIANHYTFTLMDAVSYDRKHNEDNGEDNRDGTDYNYSWNCGTEGVTRKKKINSMRLKQMKNALTILFLSQGTPMIYAGDEMGRSRRGNNNPYCQDNEITWIDWTLLDKNKEITDYVKSLVKFRKSHRVLHMKEEPRFADYKSTGLPDVSFHGMEPWRADFSYGSRQLAVMYNGQYGENEKNIYVAMNAYWEDMVFNIPQSKLNGEWRTAFSTEDREELKLPLKRTVTVPARSVIVLEEYETKTEKNVDKIANKGIEEKAAVKDDIK